MQGPDMHSITALMVSGGSADLLQNRAWGLAD